MHRLEAQRVDELIDELLGGEIKHLELRPPGEDLVTDGVQQVRFSQADATVKEERVVAVRRALGDGARGGVGELVGAADDEGVEEVLVEQLRGLTVQGLAVALFQRVHEALVGSGQHEAALVLALHRERSDPGGVLLGLEDGTQALLQTGPVARGRRHGVGWISTVFPQFAEIFLEAGGSTGVEI